jgi:predicted MPP superfamily phosphohydrolase
MDIFTIGFYTVSYFPLIYIATVSLFAVILTFRDKKAARKSARRVKERTLITVSIFGGSVAMILTMLAVRHKTRHKKFMVGIPLIIIVQAAIIVFVLNSSLSVSRYNIETEKIGEEIKLALITDLHSCDYGDGQRELISVIDAERPNVILLCGDIFDDVLPPENTTELIQYISGKYPCYYVTGNHEFWSGQADEFKAILESYGVKVLEGTSEVLEIGGEKIRISGIDDPDTDRYPSRSVPYAEQISRLSEEITADDLFTILLSHRPERMDELLPLNPDLVLSGHAHGGQWRLPMLLENGLLSPNQGLFPKYTNGEYLFDNTILLVSRGLARESTRVIPRIFNRPEIVIIILK